jgi:O-antigen ligase
MGVLERYNISRPQVILVAGILFGFLMIMFFRFLKSTYATFLTFGMMIPFVIMIVGNAKRFLWAILIMCLPITVDITLGSAEYIEHMSGTSGYLLSLFEIVLAGLYIIWFTEIIRRKDMSIDFFPRMTIPALFLIGIAALSMVFARFPSLSGFEIIEVLKMYFCFLYLANNIKSESDIRFVVTFLILGLFFEGILGFAQHRYSEPFWPKALGGPGWIGDRISGTWVSPNDFAWCLTFILPIALSILFSGIKPFYKLLCGLTFFLSSASLMWSNSRGGWISLGIGVLFGSLFVFNKIKGKKGLIKTFIWIVFVLILISPLFPRLSNKFVARFGGSDRGSAQSRLPQYNVAYSIIRSNPIIGVGVNNYTEVMHDYDITTDEGLESITPNAVHNIFLHIAAEMGILGIVTFIWFITTIFVEGMASISKGGFMAYTVIGMLAGIMAFLVHGMVDTASLGSKLYMFVWFFAGIIFAVRKINPVANLAS